MAAKTKEDKQCLKRRAIILRRCLKKYATTIRQKEKGITPLTIMAMIGHQPTPVLNLLEDDLSHRSTLGPDDDAAKAVWQTCFVAMLPRDDDDAGDEEATNQEEEYQC